MKSRKRSRIMYIELKSCQGHNDNGPARIGRVYFSKTGRTLYYRGRRFQSAKGAEFCGDYYDVDAGDVYWISGCKRNGRDRHPVGSGPVEIDGDVRREYWTEIREQPERVDETVA